MSTAIRSVHLSDFPCAVAGIRSGHIAWMFPSEPLIKGGCYPGKKELESPSAVERWASFHVGANERTRVDGRVRHWFQIFGQHDYLHDLYVTEHYLPARVMNTLVVLLTLDEEELFGSDADEDDGVDD